MAEKAPGGVQSVERVFELLELITDAGGDVTLSELSSSTDLPLPTIHRLLRTLVTLGYIRQLPNRRYALGPRLIRLGEGANKQLGALARPQLKSLVDRLGETSNMAVLDSDMVIYVAQVPSLHSMRMFTEVGRRAHTHDTGVGKAILAQLDDEVVRGIVPRTGMPTPTPKSIGDFDSLIADLKPHPGTRLLHRRGGAGARRPLLRHGRARTRPRPRPSRCPGRCPAWTSPSPTAPCRCSAKQPRRSRTSSTKTDPAAVVLQAPRVDATDTRTCPSEARRIA